MTRSHRRCSPWPGSPPVYPAQEPGGGAWPYDIGELQPHRRSVPTAMTSMTCPSPESERRARARARRDTPTPSATDSEIAAKSAAAACLPNKPAAVTAAAGVRSPAPGAPRHDHSGRPHGVFRRSRTGRGFRRHTGTLRLLSYAGSPRCRSRLRSTGVRRRPRRWFPRSSSNHLPCRSGTSGSFRVDPGERMDPGAVGKLTARPHPGACFGPRPSLSGGWRGTAERA